MIAILLIVAAIVFVLGIMIAYNCGYDRGYSEAYYGAPDYPAITGFDAESHSLDNRTFEEEVERRMREMALESERVPGALKETATEDRRHERRLA